MHMYMYVYVYIHMYNNTLSLSLVLVLVLNKYIYIYIYIYDRRGLRLLRLLLRHLRLYGASSTYITTQSTPTEGLTQADS